MEPIKLTLSIFPTKTHTASLKEHKLCWHHLSYLLMHINQVKHMQSLPSSKNKISKNQEKSRNQTYTSPKLFLKLKPVYLLCCNVP